MERVRQISIDPYVDGGGILGQKIRVNEEAEEKVMRATALLRDVVVLREDAERHSINYSGQGGAIEMSKSSSVFIPDKSERASDVSSVSLNDGRWEVTVLDQELHRDVDDWMKGEYKKSGSKSGPDLFKEKYINELSQEVSRGISKASSIEKNDRLKFTTINAVIQDGSIGIVALGTAVGVGSIYFGIDDYLSGENFGERMAGLIKVTAGALFIHTSLPFRTIVHANHEGWSKWEHFFPNPQARSRIKGRIALRKNKEILLEERD